jgi:hypothetical protein
MPQEVKRTKKRTKKEPVSNKEFIDERTSQKILKIVAVQQQEEENKARIPDAGAVSHTTREVASDDELSSDGNQEDDDEYNALLEIQLDPEQVSLSRVSNNIARCHGQVYACRPKLPIHHNRG